MTLTVLLPPAAADLSTKIARELANRGYECYLVGGLIRDALLRSAHGTDVDLATDAEPPETRRALEAAGADATFAVGERFGTIGAMFVGVKVEVTTYRSEEYTAGSRKPRVAFHAGLGEDLARRDFTINAIALNPLSGEIVDPFGGREDLANGLLRAVGSARARFEDDPLRILRAVRFAARLGFQIEPATAHEAQLGAAGLGTISRERVREELDRILLSPSPSSGSSLLCELGLAPYTLPDLVAMRGMRQEAGRHKDVFGHTLQVLDRTPPRLAVRWAGLLHDIAKPITMRVHSDGDVHFFGHDTRGETMSRRILADLKQPNELVDRVGRLVGLHLRANAYDADWTDGALRRFVREVGDDLLADLLALSRADVTSGRVDRRLSAAQSVSDLERRIRDLREREDIAHLTSPLDGNDLMALFGRQPGSWIRPIKDRLLELVLDGQLAQDDRAGAIEIARDLDANFAATGVETGALGDRSGTGEAARQARVGQVQAASDGLGIHP